jgi:hypothetical protein
MYPIIFRAGRPQQEFANGFVFLAGEGEAAPVEGGAPGLSRVEHDLSLGLRVGH